MLYERLKQDMMNARKSKDSEKSLWLSGVIGELQRGGGKEFEDTQVVSLIKKNLATLNENLKASPGHEATRKEIDFLYGYLPQQMSEDEVREAVRTLIADGANNIKLVMSGLQTHYAGLYDGRLASGIVKDELAKSAG